MPTTTTESSSEVVIVLPLSVKNENKSYSDFFSGLEDEFTVEINSESSTTSSKPNSVSKDVTLKDVTYSKSTSKNVEHIESTSSKNMHNEKDEKISFQNENIDFIKWLNDIDDNQKVKIFFILNFFISHCF